MKFFPENKKKTIVLTAIFIVALGGIVYVNFFSGRSGTALLPQTNESPARSGSASPVSGGLLPYGAKIDTRILDDERFAVLRPGPGVRVTAEELGQPNLFGAPE